jgi:hypothetical protein
MAKVVIFMEDGIAQSVLADGEDVEVIILDGDIDGIEDDNPRLKQFEDDTYYVAEGVDLVDPEYVNEVFRGVGGNPEPQSNIAKG